MQGQPGTRSITVATMKAKGPAADYQRNVFINCPFDLAYQPIFRALVFTVYAANLRPRCALEIGDSSRVRLDKILQIIEECRLGIHDISRTQLDEKSLLPR